MTEQKCSKLDVCSARYGICLGNHDAMAMCPEWITAHALEKLIAELTTKIIITEQSPHPEVSPWKS